MFLNFFLRKKLKQMSGVDIRWVRLDDTTDAEWESQCHNNWERWCRNWMGLRDSPFRSIQWLVRLKLEAYANSRERTDPFHWEKVLYNLLGTKGYCPDLPWAMKVRFDEHLT